MELLHLQLAGGALELLDLVRAGLSLTVLVTVLVLELVHLVAELLELVTALVVMGCRGKAKSVKQVTRGHRPDGLHPATASHARASRRARGS